MAQLIIVNEDSSVSIAALSEDANIEKEAEKLGGIVYDRAIPNYPCLKMQDNIVVADLSGYLDLLKSDAIQSISAFAATTRQTIAGAADHYQTAGWSDKRARAMRIKSGTPEADDIDIVQHEATRRGKNETVLELVELQLSKAKKFAIAMSDIDGMQAAAEDSINAITEATRIPALLDALKSEAEQQIAVLLS